MSAIDDMSGIDWNNIFGGGDPWGDGLVDPTIDPNITDNGDPYYPIGGVPGTGTEAGAVTTPWPNVGGGGAGVAPGGSSAGLGEIIKAITGGGSGVGSLMAMLAPLLGAGLQYKATGKASDQMQQAAKDANALVSGIYGGSKDMYMPYVTAGQNALAKAQGMGYQPMAQNYKPLGSGAAMTLGKLGGR